MKLASYSKLNNINIGQISVYYLCRYKTGLNLFKMFVQVDLELRPKNLIYITWTCPEKIDAQINFVAQIQIDVPTTICKENKSFHYSTKENTTLKMNNPYKSSRIIICNKHLWASCEVQNFYTLHLNVFSYVSLPVQRKNSVHLLIFQLIRTQL